MAKAKPGTESDSALPLDSASSDICSDATPEDHAEDQVNPAVAAVLTELWSAWSQQHGPLSLARLCKRSGLRMSTLKRFLTELETCGIVNISVNTRGVECAALTEAAARQLDKATSN